MNKDIKLPSLPLGNGDPIVQGYEPDDALLREYARAAVELNAPRWQPTDEQIDRAMCAVHMPFFPGHTQRETDLVIKRFVQELAKQILPLPMNPG